MSEREREPEFAAMLLPGDHWGVGQKTYHKDFVHGTTVAYRVCYVVDGLDDLNTAMRLAHNYADLMSRGLRDWQGSTQAEKATRGELAAARILEEDYGTDRRTALNVVDDISATLRHYDQALA